MRARPLIAAGLAVCLALAGCVGQLDEDETPTREDDAPANATTWETSQASGTVTGASSPAGSVNQGGGDSASFQVPNGTRVLYLNVTTEGGELDWQYGPDCQTDPAVSCEHNSTTEDGQDSQVLREPTPGSWDAYFFLAQDEGAGEVDWTLTVTAGVEG